MSCLLTQVAWNRQLARSLSLQTSGAGSAAASLTATLMRRCERVSSRALQARHAMCDMATSAYGGTLAFRAYQAWLLL